MAESDPSTRRGWVLGPTPGDGGLAVARQPVVVVDLGTGVGDDLDVLLLDDDRAAEVEAAAAALGVASAPEDGPPVEVTLRPAAGDRHVVLASSGLGQDGEETSPRVAAADALLGALTRARLDAHPSWSHVHGGAVCDAAGRAVLVLGASGAGKSTLVAHLAAGGLDLVSDEQVSLHRVDGMVGGFTRPVAVKPGGVRHLPPSVVDAVPDTGHVLLVPADGLGAHHRVVARPAAVLVPERDPSREGATAEPLTAAEAIEVLAANNLDLVRDPQEALSAFAWLACGVPVVRLRYGEATAAVDLVADLLRSDPPGPAARWQVTTVPGHLRAPDGGPEPVVRARPGVVEVEVGDDLVVVDPASRRLSRLTEAEGAAWRTLPWPSVPDATPGGPGPLAVALDLLERGLVEVGRSGAVVRRRVPGLVSRRLRTEVLVADGDDRVARLEGAGAVVWDALAEPADPGEVVRRIVDDPGPADAPGTDPPLDADLVAARVSIALVQLEDAGLVEPAPTSGLGPDVRAG